MKLFVRSAITTLALIGCTVQVSAACNSLFDPRCKIGPGLETIAPVDQEPGGGAVDGKATTGALWPVRKYLKAKDIPPLDAGAYGVVVLSSKPTPANQSKLLMFCNSFIAHFPRSETTAAAISDQMITVWPLEEPDAKAAKEDDCNFVLQRYDLNGATAAAIDARRQRADLSGPGPFLVGWSPSSSRGVPDALVLVVTFADDETQEQIDRKFDYWKDEIVQDPAKWRRGFVADRIRESIRKFADRYGQAMLDAIKLIGGSKS